MEDTHKREVNYKDFINSLKEVNNIKCCGENISSIEDVIEQFDLISNSVNNIISKLKTVESTKVDDFKLLDLSFKILGIRTDIRKFEDIINNL